MITCKQFKDYVLDNLSESKKKSFEVHMNGCERCKRAFNEEKIIISAFSAVPKVQTPHGFSHKIIDDVHLIKSKSFAWKVYVASIVALFGITGFLTDFSVKIALTKISVFTEIANSLGHSIYVAINNISSVLYDNIPAGTFTTGLILTLSFFVTGFILYKTAFSESEVKKR